MLYHNIYKVTTSLSFKEPFDRMHGLYMLEKRASVIVRAKREQQKTRAIRCVVMRATKKTSYFPLYWLFNRDPYNLMGFYNPYTLPEINMAPENGWLEY